MKKLLLPGLIIVSALQACKHEPLLPVAGENVPPVIAGHSCDEDTAYFAEQVLPIFQSSCAVPGCHDVTDQDAGFIFDSYENIIASGEIEPGDSSEGEIVDVIEDGDMPPSQYAPLSDEQLALIQTWIDQGALNNSCPDALCDTVDVTFSGDIAPIVQNSCQGCHNGNFAQGGVTLENYDDINALVIFNSLPEIIGGDGEEALMPPNNPLSDCQVRMFEIWIENGAPND